MSCLFGFLKVDVDEAMKDFCKILNQFKQEKKNQYSTVCRRQCSEILVLAPGIKRSDMPRNNLTPIS
jgi:hypothetical protein